MTHPCIKFYTHPGQRPQAKLWNADIETVAQWFELPVEDLTLVEPDDGNGLEYDTLYHGAIVLGHFAWDKEGA